jgi:hypothetical protein
MTKRGRRKKTKNRKKTINGPDQARMNPPKDCRVSSRFIDAINLYTFLLTLATAVPSTVLTLWPPLVVVFGQQREMAIRTHILALSKVDAEYVYKEVLTLYLQTIGRSTS